MWDSFTRVGLRFQGGGFVLAAAALGTQPTPDVAFLGVPSNVRRWRRERESIC